MGTNYFLHRDCCEHCNRPSERLFIGKNSGPGYFALKAYDSGDLIINDLSEWMPLLTHAKSKIFNEYDVELTADQLVEIITAKGRNGEMYTVDSSPHGDSGW